MAMWVQRCSQSLNVRSCKISEKTPYKVIHTGINNSSSIGLTIVETIYVIKAQYIAEYVLWSFIDSDSGLSSLQYSNRQSFSGTFKMQSSGDMFGEMKSGWSSLYSQDLSQDSDSGFRSTSLSLDDGIDISYSDDDSIHSSQFSTLSQSTVASDKSDDGWTTVGSKKGNLGTLNFISKEILLFKLES